MGRFLNYLNSAPLISVLRVPKLWFWKPLESNGMPGESLVYILSENCSVICGISKNINKLYLHLAIFWTNITLWAYYIHMAKLLHCMLVHTVISPLCLFFHRKNSKLNLPSAHSKSKQLILITQDYGNSCWLVNHYVLLMSEKEGRVKQNSPLKNYSATKNIFFLPWEHNSCFNRRNASCGFPINSQKKIKQFT